MSAVREEIRSKLATGISVSQIARELGLSANTVSYHRRAIAGESLEEIRSRDLTAADAVRPSVPTPAPRQIETRDTVARLLAAGTSRADAARELGLSKSTVSYHARRLGEHVDVRCARRYDWPAVQTYYDAGHTLAECVETFGFSRQTWHAAVNRGAVISRPIGMSLEELCVAGTWRSRPNVKRRLLASGLRTNRCERCDIATWLDAPLSLHLHHVNGDACDNRAENLKLLCPNCHSQTSNFSGRKRRRATEVAALGSMPR